MGNFKFSDILYKQIVIVDWKAKVEGLRYWQWSYSQTTVRQEKTGVSGEKPKCKLEEEGGRGSTLVMIGPIYLVPQNWWVGGIVTKIHINSLEIS